MGKYSRWAGPLFEGHICSLGYAVIDWILEYTCHGIGDIQGERFEGIYDLDDEIRDHVIRCYELDPVTGRRMFNEAVLSRPKGRAKSEIAGIIATAEAFADCVRFDGWDADGQPVGKAVRSPLIKCLATEESQAGNTFANIAFIAGEWGQDNHPEIYGGAGGVRRYQSASAIYLPKGGEIRASTSGAASKDGGLETHVVADETHLYVLQELRNMYGTVSRNLGKRYDADAWLHQTSTAYRPGENSVFETTLTLWRKGQLPESVFMNHREATGKIDLDDKERTKRQLREVYGPAAEWIDLDRKYRDMRDPRICADDETAARYFLNRPMSSKDAWIPDDVVKRQARPGDSIAKGDAVALGFDGSLNDDSTVLFASRMSDGFIQPLGIWSKPAGPAGNFWEVPRRDVIRAIKDAFEDYDVTRLYADPHEWRTDIDDLAEEFGERVFPWATSRDSAMGAALDRIRTDMVTGGETLDGEPDGKRTGVLFHSGDKEMMEHFSNGYVRKRGIHRLVRKEHDKSDRKIDSIIGAALAYEARADALTAGWTAGYQANARISNAVYGFN